MKGPVYIALFRCRVNHIWFIRVNKRIRDAKSWCPECLLDANPKWIPMGTVDVVDIANQSPEIYTAPVRQWTPAREMG